MPVAEDSQYPDLPQVTAERQLRRAGMASDMKDWSMFDHFADLTPEAEPEAKALGLRVIGAMQQVGEQFLAGDLRCWWEAFPELNPELGL
jgi:hypothetical protein